MDTYETSVGIQTLCNSALFFGVIVMASVVMLLMLRHFKYVLGGCITIVAMGASSLVCGGGTGMVFGGASGVLMALIIGGLTAVLMIPFLRWVNWLKPYYRR